MYGFVSSISGCNDTTMSLKSKSPGSGKFSSKQYRRLCLSPSAGIDDVSPAMSVPPISVVSVPPAIVRRYILVCPSSAVRAMYAVFSVVIRFIAVSKRPCPCARPEARSVGLSPPIGFPAYIRMVYIDLSAVLSVVLTVTGLMVSHVCARSTSVTGKAPLTISSYTPWSK